MEKVLHDLRLSRIASHRLYLQLVFFVFAFVIVYNVRFIAWLILYGRMAVV